MAVKFAHALGAHVNVPVSLMAPSTEGVKFEVTFGSRLTCWNAYSVNAIPFSRFPAMMNSWLILTDCLDHRWY